MTLPLKMTAGLARAAAARPCSGPGPGPGLPLPLLRALALLVLLAPARVDQSRGNDGHIKKRSGKAVSYAKVTFLKYFCHRSLWPPPSSALNQENLPHRDREIIESPHQQTIKKLPKADPVKGKSPSFQFFNARQIASCNTSSQIHEEEEEEEGEKEGGHQEQDGQPVKDPAERGRHHAQGLVLLHAVQLLLLRG